MRKAYCTPVIRTQQLVLGVFGEYGEGGGDGGNVNPPRPPRVIEQFDMHMD